MLESHEFADLFPKLDGAELSELAEDIKANGLKQSIMIYRGKILDGRNRYAACIRAGVLPTTTDFIGTDQEALAYVVSTNLRRRHLGTADRAIIAKRITTLKHGQTKAKLENNSYVKDVDTSNGVSTENQDSSFELSTKDSYEKITHQPIITQAEAAKIMNVSVRSIQRVGKTTDPQRHLIKTAKTAIGVIVRALKPLNLQKYEEPLNDLLKYLEALEMNDLHIK